MHIIAQGMMMMMHMILPLIRLIDVVRTPEGCLSTRVAM